MRYLFLAGALLALQAGPARSQALQNGSFEATRLGNRQLPASWDITPAPGYSIALDSTVAQDGRRALHLASTTEVPQGRQAFQQAVAVQVARPTIMRLEATVRTSEANNVALSCQYWDDMKLVGLTNSLLQGAPPSGTSEWRTLSISLLVQPTMRRVVVGGFYTGKGQAWFDEVKLNVMPAYPETAPSAAVEAYLKQAITIARANSLVRASIDWPNAEQQMLAMAHGMQTPADTYPLFAYLLGLLRQHGDRHSGFRPPAVVQASEAPATAANATAIAEPSARYLGEGLAYVAVPEFVSLNNERQVAFATQLQKLISQLDAEHSVTGWVVDLRGNRGGNMNPMLAGLGALTGTGTLAYFVGGRRDSPISYRSVLAKVNGKSKELRMPAPLRRPGSPVAVLIDSYTGSSGEVTAIAFRGRPATRLFGQPSAGYTTANSLFRLTDGAELNLAVYTEADRKHRVYTGSLVPDEVVPAASPTSADATLAAATSWLQQQVSAGKP